MIAGLLRLRTNPGQSNKTTVTLNFMQWLPHCRHCMKMGLGVVLSDWPRSACKACNLLCVAYRLAGMQALQASLSQAFNTTSTLMLRPLTCRQSIACAHMQRTRLILCADLADMCYMQRCEEPHLQALREDGLLLGLPQICPQRVHQPGPELDGVALGVDGEPVVAGRHDHAHELVGADLQPASSAKASLWVWQSMLKD